jgi:2-polyprenyl-3-methyl-5-hydroxy-6-metoxy-1,4-benzoquinol methylase
VDYVERALEQARAKNQAAQTDVTFIQADVRELTQVIKSQFGFILDYSLLHHIADPDVAAYTSQFLSLLQNHGKLLVVCYTPEHHRSQGQRQVTGKYGNTMFFRTEAEIRELYKDLHQVWYQKTTLGKDNEHPAHAFLFEKP